MNGRFEIIDTPLPGAKLIQRRALADERGFLERLYCADELAAVGGGAIAQINLTRTHRRGTVRGLHYQQPPHAEAKWVTCLRGRVFDVAVDLRLGSPTFLCWHGEILSEENRCSYFIPPGFAHGLQTLCDDCEMLYLHTMSFDPASERGLHPQDPRLAVEWPEPVVGLSTRDAGQRLIGADFDGVRL